MDPQRSQPQSYGRTAAPPQQQRPITQQRQETTEPGLYALARNLPQPWVDGAHNPAYTPALKALRDIWFKIEPDRRKTMLYFESQAVLGESKDPATLFGLYSAQGAREEARKVLEFSKAIRLIPLTVTQQELVERGVGRFTQKGNLHYNLSNVAAEALATLLEEVGKRLEAGRFRENLRQVATQAAERRARAEKRRAEAAASAEPQTPPAEGEEGEKA